MSLPDEAMKLSLAVLAAIVAPAAAQAPAFGEDEDLTALSLEELMNIEVEVTSVSRRSQRVENSAAAVYVLTSEDLRRSGATSLMEALRMVPGLNVARVDSSSWAISARGFNDLFSDKLLVLMDGRTLYTPLFSGLFWDVQDYPLEDVERIEVIRGPGATIWGANAVNGVINIITKSAYRTTGTQVVAGGGNEERGFGHVRHGGSLGETGAWRAYVKYFDRDQTESTSSYDPDDEWSMLRAGFRADFGPSDEDEVTLQGDVYVGRAGQRPTVASTASPPTAVVDADRDLSGGNVLARWTRTLSDTSSWQLQTYYDRTFRESGDLFEESRDTLDVDFNHDFHVADGHRTTWGLGYRLMMVDIDDSFEIQFDPTSRNDQLVSAFVQHEWRAREDLVVTAGTKLEHNDYSGFEIQPSLRAIWDVAGDHSVWASISRAIRQPSQVDQDITLIQAAIPNGMGGFDFPALVGDDDVDSEVLYAYELGYRSFLGEALSLDVATFFHDYDRLVIQEPGAPVAMGNDTLIPIVQTNNATGTAWGVETVAQWNVCPRWNLNASYTFLELDIRPDGDSQSPNAEDAERTSPEQQFHLRSHLDVTEDVDFDVLLYLVDRLRNVPGYARGDVRLAWRPCEGLELSAVAQGLFHDEQVEFGSTAFGSGSKLASSFFLKAVWSF